MTIDSDIDLFLVRPDHASDEQWDEQVAELMAEVTRWTEPNSSSTWPRPVATSPTNLDGVDDAVTTFWVHAGIATSDVIHCARPPNRHRGR